MNSLYDSLTSSIVHNIQLSPMPRAGSNAGQTTADWISNYITTPLILIGAGLVILALVIVGIKIIMKAGSSDQGGSGFREAISSVAKVLIGGLIIGGAGAIGALIITIGQSFG